MCNQLEFDKLQQVAQKKAIPAVRAILRGYGEDVEDVLQDAAFSAWKHIDSFKKEASFTTWYVRICINAALMQLRHRKAGATYLTYGDVAELGMASVKAKDKDPERLALESQFHEQLEKAVKELPRFYRLAARRYLREEKSINVTDKTQRCRARNILKEKLVAWM